MNRKHYFVNVKRYLNRVDAPTYNMREHYNELMLARLFINDCVGRFDENLYLFGVVDCNRFEILEFMKEIHDNSLFKELQNGEYVLLDDVISCMVRNEG